MKNTTKSLALLAALTPAAAAQAQAVLTYTGGNNPQGSFFGNSTGDSIGYRFSVLENVTVTTVGTLNNASTDGSIDSRHDWGIWDSNQALLASGFIDPDHGYQLGEFFYSEFAFELNLTPGEIYTIAITYAHDDGDTFISSPATLTTDPVINITNGVYPPDPSLGLVYPPKNSGNLARLGPNFLFSPTVPCTADVNNDGELTAADFTAWINAFNNNDPECDQNDDGSCTPTDFTAWIANFNAGC